MSDVIVRATAANANIRIFAADTHEMVEHARQAHNTSPVMTAALGRLLTAGAMMGVMQKGDADLLTLQIKGGGPAKGLTVTADSHGRVKGYAVVPDVMLPPNAAGKLDVGGALAPGFLTVIKDLGLKEPYIGETMLVTGEIGDDLTEYFMSSEQVPSSVGLGVLMNKDNTVKRAGGFIVQLMPFADEEVISRLEENLKKITSVTALLDGGATPEDIVKLICDGFDIEFNDTIPTSFYCNCSKERFAKGLISLNDQDMQEMIDSGETIEVNCRFCGKHYYFDTEELKEINNLRK
ncbi:MAG: Hsp33 family molecular chaperone HslO [Lachnospiraceae bacterium]|nr:Hsp33 family molecular chaperone HslO [Lachnospiraceae bacterium]